MLQGLRHLAQVLADVLRAQEDGRDQAIEAEATQVRRGAAPLEHKVEVLRRGAVDGPPALHQVGCQREDARGPLRPLTLESRAVVLDAHEAEALL